MQPESSRAESSRVWSSRVTVTVAVLNAIQLQAKHSALRGHRRSFDNQGGRRDFGRQNPYPVFSSSVLVQGCINGYWNTGTRCGPGEFRLLLRARYPAGSLFGSSTNYVWHFTRSLRRRPDGSDRNERPWHVATALAWCGNWPQGWPLGTRRWPTAAPGRRRWPPQAARWPTADRRHLTPAADRLASAKKHVADGNPTDPCVCQKCSQVVFKLR